MTAGINGRAIDFAKFGRLFLNNSAWNGTQIVPAAWVVESAAPDPNDQRPWRSERSENVWREQNGYYKYLWWGKCNPYGSYTYEAHGKRGQRIAVSPSTGVVVVRFGTDMGGVTVGEVACASAQGRWYNRHTSPFACNDWIQHPNHATNRGWSCFLEFCKPLI